MIGIIVIGNDRDKSKVSVCRGGTCNLLKILDLLKELESETSYKSARSYDHARNGQTRFQQILFCSSIFRMFKGVSLIAKALPIKASVVTMAVKTAECLLFG